MINTIKFELYDPVDAGEDWAVDNNYGVNAVEIYIDGEPLLDMLSRFEIPYYISKGIKIDTRELLHGHLDPKSLYIYLSDALEEGSYSNLYGAFLFSCSSCGDPGCNGAIVHITGDDGFVYWKDFEHSHWGDISYDLSFTFEKSQYEAALSQLQGMIPRTERTDCLKMWKTIKKSRRYAYQSRHYKRSRAARDE